MHDGVADAVHNGLVNFRLLAHQCELGLLVELFAHISYNTVHLLESAGNRHHPQRHGNILQFIGELAQLSCGFQEAVELQVMKLRGRNYHGLSNDDFSHNGHEHIQLGKVDTD